MNQEKKSSLVILCVTPKDESLKAPDSLTLETEAILNRYKSHCVQLKPGVFLLKQDECYPAIIEIITRGNEKKDATTGKPTAHLLIAELAELPVILSSEHKASSLIKNTGRTVREIAESQRKPQ